MVTPGLRSKPTQYATASTGGRAPSPVPLTRSHTTGSRPSPRSSSARPRVVAKTRCPSARHSAATRLPRYPQPTTSLSIVRSPGEGEAEGLSTEYRVPRTEYGVGRGESLTPPHPVPLPSPPPPLIGY